MELAMDLVDAKTAAIELMLIDKGLLMTTLPATATEPDEVIGYSVEINPNGGWIDIGTEHAICGCFPFDTPVSEIEQWIEKRENEGMVF